MYQRKIVGLLMVAVMFAVSVVPPAHAYQPRAVSVAIALPGKVLAFRGYGRGVAMVRSQNALRQTSKVNVQSSPVQAVTSVTVSEVVVSKQGPTPATPVAQSQEPAKVAEPAKPAKQDTSVVVGKDADLRLNPEGKKGTEETSTEKAKTEDANEIKITQLRNGRQVTCVNGVCKVSAGTPFRTMMSPVVNQTVKQSPFVYRSGPVRESVLSRPMFSPVKSQGTIVQCEDGSTVIETESYGRSGFMARRHHRKAVSSAGLFR